MTDPAPRTCTVLQTRAEFADPHTVSDIRDRRSILDCVFDALVRRDHTGRFAPWLATHWTVSADGRTWTFTLRPDIRCHDGGPLDAQDVAASIRRALDPALPGELGTEGVLRGYLGEAAIAVPDASTLRLTTAEPLADLLDLLVDLPVVPARAFAGIGTREAVGSGAYRVAAIAPGRVELARFDDHWAGRARADRVTWLAEPDAARRLDRYRAGEADWVVDPPRAAAVADPACVRAPGFLCIIFLFNLFAGPARDPRVRRALSHALDRTALIRDPDIMAGAAAPLAGPLTARHLGGTEAAQSDSFDPDEARRLLAAAGHRDGLDLAIDLPARFPDEAEALARAIATQWSAVGVRCSLRVHQDRPGYANQVRAKAIGDLCCFDSSPASPHRVFCEKLDDRRQGPWWMGYGNAAVNALIDAAAREPDDRLRTTIFGRAAELVQADCPWLFLYAPDTLWLRRPGSDSLAPSPEGRLRSIAKGT